MTMYMQYIEAIKALATSPNAKIVLFPLGADSSSALMDQVRNSLVVAGEATKVDPFPAAPADAA